MHYNLFMEHESFESAKNKEKDSSLNNSRESIDSEIDKIMKDHSKEVSGVSNSKLTNLNQKDDRIKRNSKGKLRSSLGIDINSKDFDMNVEFINQAKKTNNDETESYCHQDDCESSKVQLEQVSRPSISQNSKAASLLNNNFTQSICKDVQSRYYDLVPQSTERFFIDKLKKEEKSTKKKTKNSNSISNSSNIQSQKSVSHQVLSASGLISCQRNTKLSEIPAITKNQNLIINHPFSISIQNNLQGMSSTENINNQYNQNCVMTDIAVYNQENTFSREQINFESKNYKPKKKETGSNSLSNNSNPRSLANTTKKLDLKKESSDTNKQDDESIQFSYPRIGEAEDYAIIYHKIQNLKDENTQLTKKNNQLSATIAKIFQDNKQLISDLELEKSKRQKVSLAIIN